METDMIRKTVTVESYIKRKRQTYSTRFLLIRIAYQICCEVCCLLQLNLDAVQNGVFWCLAYLLFYKSI